ncbi:hypothetical protein [Cypionkella psychrotolerans]|uniref:hypothetical protein n=1 Tax=Cypionkella psychrotolerans TaxID=1678131 RepID=UPI0006B6694E
MDATGSASDNLLIANTAANHLWGMQGNDTLMGGGGADTLNGALAMTICKAAQATMPIMSTA